MSIINNLVENIGELYQAFALAERTRVTDASLHRAFETVLSQLEGQGTLRHLSFGELVLVQPERLDAYASALLIAVGGQQTYAQARFYDGRIHLVSITNGKMDAIKLDDAPMGWQRQHLYQISFCLVTLPDLAPALQQP